MFRPQPISSTDARKYFTKLINKVSFSSKSFVIQSYRRPLVRIVNENYIRALEDVVGKKTVNQVMQIAGDERLLEAEKIEEIKKVFQRRLSGSPQTKPQTQKRQNVAATHQSGGQAHASPVTPKPPAQNPKSQPSPKPKNPNPQRPQNRRKGREVLLLPDGKNYQ